MKVPQPPRPQRSSNPGTVYIDGEAGWNQFWASLGDEWQQLNMVPVLQDELEPIERLHEDYFFDARGPGGEMWAPLAPSTIAAKGSSVIMIDSGRLLASLTQSGPDAIRLVQGGNGSFELVFGTDVTYSVFHDEPTANRPARQHVGWNDESLDEVTFHVLDGAIEAMSNGPR